MYIKLDKDAIMPERAHEEDAGLDLKSPIAVLIAKGGSETIDTGVHVELPPSTVGMLKSKSGLNIKYGILSEGVIDEGYSGSIRVKLYNHGPQPYLVNRGDKITQLVILPCMRPGIIVVDALAETARGEHGFGSTGR